MERDLVAVTSAGFVAESWSMQKDICDTGSTMFLSKSSSLFVFPS